MQKLLISTLLISSLFIYFGCQNPSSTDPASELDKKTPTWDIPGDFATIQAAIDDPMVMDGDIIRVTSGNHSGALVDKKVTIKGQGNAVINDGPAHSSGLIQGFRMLAGSGGSMISHLTFTTDLSIMNGEAVDDVTVTQCTFINSVQAISNWVGSNWDINHNTITDLRTRCGGGIGIFLGDYTGAGILEGNIISHNTVSGTLHVSDGDCGGYSGTGIVLYADFRFGRLGVDELKNNFVTHNTVSLVSDNPGVVPAVAFELTDTRNDPFADVLIFDNSIGFNDFRGTETQIALTPEELEDHNTISRNLGDNRGHGAHPNLFKP